MSEWNYRLAQPEDAEAFAQWAATNPQIDPKDLEAGMRKNNPTVLTVVAELDGVAVAFAPVYLSAVLAHLGFNPDADPKDKLKALDVLRDGTAALMVQFGIREITTLSKPEYGVAKWAVKHNFEQEPRQLFRLDLNAQMAVK
jgi:hypothetical protein